MTRHAVVFLAALALVAGACSGSAPEGFEPPPTPVLAATSTPAPSATATATPVPEPTATAAPTATPAPSDEELAVIAAWERYVVLSHEARAEDPSAAALDFESYMMAGALDGILRAIQGDQEADRYLDGPVRTTVLDATERTAGEMIVNACVVSNLSSYSVDGGSLIFAEGEREIEATGRLTYVNDRWLVAATEFEGGSCEL